MSNKIYTIETIKEHQDKAGELFEFSEVIAIMRENGELSEKLLLAFTLGYMKAREVEEA